MRHGRKVLNAAPRSITACTARCVSLLWRTPTKPGCSISPPLALRTQGQMALEPSDFWPIFFIILRKKDCLSTQPSTFKFNSNYTNESTYSNHFYLILRRTNDSFFSVANPGSIQYSFHEENITLLSQQVSFPYRKILLQESILFDIF